MICSLLISLLPTILAFSNQRQTNLIENKLKISSSIRAMEKAVWDAERSMYVGDVGSGVQHDEAVVRYLETASPLRIFGYGSLCWNPGEGCLAKQGVTSRPGRAIGYKRCWAQKTTDHRGNPSFPGLVCTLLKDEEVRKFNSPRNYLDEDEEEKPNMVEGLVYSIPDDQADDCLAELDIRELTGAYARDVVEVVDIESGETIQALLYRGTPENPNFSERALLDLSYAAAVIAVAVGPSGRNDEYLFSLDHFMMDPIVSSASKKLKNFHGDTETTIIADMTKALQNQQLFFLIGCGSNQHNQLLLKSKENKSCLINGEDAHKMTEVVLCTSKEGNDKLPIRAKQLAAGSGHSALLTECGKLYLWGWNEAYQLGRSSYSIDHKYENLPMSVVPKLLDIVVDRVALGFSHTLLIEKYTGKLWAFGSNDRGQVCCKSKISPIKNPTIQFPEMKFVDASAGLFHSAAITEDGALVTFGCNRFGQTLPQKSNPWRPKDSRLIRVACGRRHTIMLDEDGRVWSLGDNKYGQLGRKVEKKSNQPAPIEGVLGEKGSSCFDICCGWSHCIASVSGNGKDMEGTQLFGWGRNDKGQLGLGISEDNVSTACMIPNEVPSISAVVCGSESTMVVDRNGKIWGCGWNEHGNIGTGHIMDTSFITPSTGARPVVPAPSGGNSEVLLAAGGAHVIALRNV